MSHRDPWVWVLGVPVVAVLLYCVKVLVTNRWGLR